MKKYSNGEEAKELLIGSTFVSFDDAMRCQKVISEEQTLTVIWNKRGDGLPDMEIVCHRNWATSIYLIQKTDKEKYGYPFPAIRSFDSV